MYVWFIYLWIKYFQKVTMKKRITKFTIKNKTGTDQIQY